MPPVFGRRLRGFAGKYLRQPSRSTTLEFYVFLNPEHNHGDDPRKRLDGHVRQLELAKRYGFKGIAVGQHLSTEGFQWFPPMPLLSYLSSMATDMKMGTSVLVLPFFNPVLVAETMAFIDVATNGNSFFGAAAGWNESEFKTLGIDRKRRQARLHEGLEIIKRLWTEDDVTFHGTEFHLENVTLSLKPVQKPRPPIWMGGSTPKAAREAAEIGDAFVYSSHAPLGQLEELSKAYNAHRIQLGKGPADDVPVLRNCFVGETYEEAVQIALPYLAGSYQGFFEEHLTDVLKTGPTGGVPEAVLDRVIIGNPEQVIAGMRRVRDRLGATKVFCRMQWKGMPDAVVERALHILGERVLPFV